MQGFVAVTFIHFCDSRDGYPTRIFSVLTLNSSPRTGERLQSGSPSLLMGEGVGGRGEIGQLGCSQVIQSSRFCCRGSRDGYSRFLLIDGDRFTKG